MQQRPARHIVDVLAAAAQKAQVLEALDRAADERICRPRYFEGSHVTWLPPASPVKG